MVTPVGALGAGVGSGMASGMGAGATGVFAICFLTGSAGFAVGGGVSTLGAGGSINCDSSSTGTTSSAARISKPLCKVHINPTCNATTAKAMTALRLIAKRGAEGNVLAFIKKNQS